MIASANHVSIETQTCSNDFRVDEKNAISIRKKLSEIYHKIKIICIKNLMLLFIMGAAVLGIGLGFILRPVNFSSESISYFGLAGELFIRALRFITLPLFLCNLITGMSGLVYKTKRITLHAFFLYMGSLISSLIIGFLLVLTIKPGYMNRNFNLNSNDPFVGTILSTPYAIMDIIRNLVPDNIVQMTFQTYGTKLTSIYANFTNTTDNLTMTVFDHYSATPGTNSGTNFLGLLIFCLLFGHIIGKMGDRGKELHDFFETLSKAFLEIIVLIIWMSPIGVFSLLISTILSIVNPGDVFASISFYIVCCLIGFFTQGVIVLPLVYFILTRKNVLIILKNVSEAILVAFATSSSLVTLPVTMKCLEQKHEIKKLVSRPILFIGTSIHFTGIPMYQLIGSIFIAQLNDQTITVSQYFLVALMTMVASLTVAGIPSGGLVTIVLILDALKINHSQIGLIFTVDWFIDRFLTMLNVWGNCIVTDIIFNLNKAHIENVSTA